MGAFAKVLPVWFQWVDLRLEVHHRKMIGKNMGFHRKNVGKNHNPRMYIDDES